MSDQKSINVCTEQHLCIGCGVCAGICPVSNLQMEWNACGEYNPRDHGKCLGGCRKCLDACPFIDHSEDEDSLAEAKFGPVEGIDHTKETGYFLKSYVGHVAEAEYRTNGASGGAASWFLANILESGFVDKVVCVTPNDDPSCLFKFAIFNNPEDVRKSAKSAYYPIEISQVIKTILKDEATYAVIGLPCFLKGLSLAALSNPSLKNRIKLMAGLTCGQLKSRGLSEYLVRHLGFNPKEVKQVAFRDKAPGKPASELIFSCSDGNRKANLPWSDTYGPTWLSDQFSMDACSFCDDIFAELADVVFMDAWLPEYMSDERGTSIVLIRTKDINDIILHGIKDNKLSFEEISIEKVIKSQAGVIVKKHDMLALRLGFAKLKGEKLPHKRIKSLKPSWIDSYLMAARVKLRVASAEAMQKQRSTSDLGLDSYNDTIKPYLDRIKRIQRMQSIKHKLAFPLRIVKRLTGSAN